MRIQEMKKVGRDEIDILRRCIENCNAEKEIDSAWRFMLRAESNISLLRNMELINDSERDEMKKIINDAFENNEKTFIERG